MVLSTDKKIFTIFKWILIFIPLLLFLISILYPIGIKLLYVNSDKSFSDSSIIKQDVYDDLDNSFNDGDTYVDTLFSGPVYWFNDYFGQYGVISHVGQYLSQHVGDGMLLNNWARFICSYLDYIIYVELIFLCVYLFRWFIHFGFNLFERKRKL